MLNDIYLLSEYLVGINEKCQVEIWHIFMFGTRLESTLALYGSTRIESLRKTKTRFLVLKCSSQLGHGSDRPVQENLVR